MSKRRPGGRARKEVRIQEEEEDTSRLYRTPLSAEAAKYCSRPVAESPWGLDGLAEIQISGDRHYRPERLPSGRKERPKSARLHTMYYQNLDYVHGIADTLRTLELSNTGLFAFPQELVERLLNIETLILDDNNLTTEGFPTCFKDLVSLTSLSVRNNGLTGIPSSWSYLFQLTSLLADNNQISSLKHLERLTKLQVLSLQGNCIEEIPREFYALKKLECLNLSHNSIASVTVDVKRLINLRELDLSHNCLAFLIPDLFLLPKLDGLQVSNNEVVKIPTVALKTKNKRTIDSVDLSFNKLTRFPENVFLIAEKLDLTSNSIRVINNSAFKKLDWRTTKQLCMHDNPLNNPPRDVAEGGLKAMLHYYFETKVDSKIYQGIKVFLLGSGGCGKSSLVQTFLDQQSRLCTEDEETICLDIYDYQIDTSDDLADPRPLSLSIWDCSGNPDYMPYIFPFLHFPSLALILFDLTEYTTENFSELIGQWIDTLILRNNRAVFILIGTKADLCKEPAEKVLELAQKDTEEYIKNYLDSIDHEIGCIERLDQISAAFNEQYKQYLSLKNFKPLFHPEALITSSAQMLGFNRLESVLVELATQTKTFPSVMRVIPALWGDAENFFDDLGQNQNIISFNELANIVHKQFGLRHLTGQICQYLHDSGRAIFNEREPSFKETVVLRPSVLFEHTCTLFRHNLYDFLMDPSDKEEVRERFVRDYSAAEFTKAVELCTVHGILLHNLLKMFFGTGKRRFTLINYLCDCLQWCYRIGGPVENPDSELPHQRELNFDLERDEDGKVKTDTSKVSLLVPNLVRSPEPTVAQTHWQNAALRVSAGFRFSRFTPSMFFERLLVCLHTERLRYQYHWQNGVLAFDAEDDNVWIRVTKEDPEDKSYLVVLSCGVVTEERFNFVREEQTPTEEPVEDSEEVVALKTQLARVWKCLLPSLLEAEKVLKQYPAAWFRREVKCPECGEMTFWGEWLSPKEAQDSEAKPCRACHADILSCLLVQPRVSKRSTRPTIRSDVAVKLQDSPAPGAAAANPADGEVNEALNFDASQKRVATEGRKSVSFM
uniref:Roc domain-containing protein n=1 Tax=Macrostomum lignano TaxID=282301 RepID=A0A1I8IKK2_9PLAT